MIKINRALKSGSLPRGKGGWIALFLLLGLVLGSPACGAQAPETEGRKKITTLEQRRAALEKTIRATDEYRARQGNRMISLDTMARDLAQIRLRLPTVASPETFQSLCAPLQDAKVTRNIEDIKGELDRLPLVDLPETIRRQATEVGDNVLKTLALLKQVRRNLSPETAAQTLRRDQPELFKAVDGQEGNRLTFILLQGQMRLMKVDLETLDGRIQALRKSLTLLTNALEDASGNFRAQATRLKQDLDYLRYSVNPK